jgi:zinc/manganese transport system substrate-binding protein
MKKIIIIILIAFISGYSSAEVKVITTTTVLYDFVKEIGKEKVTVDYLCRGDQDPHFLEILPSYMLKLRKADLVFKIGLDLEKWLPQLVDGSRNDKLKIVDISEGISKKEVPSGKIDASQGDVHPYGNPHYWLDPQNARVMVNEIYEALSDADKKNDDYYKKNLDAYLAKLNSKISGWEKEMQPLKGKPLVFFHASWVYFTDRYNVKISAYVEPKPGVPPTPSHNAYVIGIVKKNNIKKIVMENYYSDNASNQIAKLTDAAVVKVPTAVYGMKGIDSYIQMMDYIINQVSK